MFNSQFSQFSYIIPYQSMQPQIQVMKIIIPKESYFQNEELKGEVWIFPSYPITIQDIIIKLRLNESWRLEHSNGLKFNDQNEQIILQFPLQIGRILNIDSQFKNLNMREYKFPFSFKIPQITPSFEFPSLNNSCSIRYSVISEFLSPYIKCAYENLIIIKSVACELNVPLQISNTSNIHKWGFIDKGSTTLCVSYNTTNYKINEQIPLNITINNIRGKMNVTYCNFSIIRRITFTNKDQKANYPTEKRIYHYKYPIKINVGLVNSFNYSLFVNDEEFNNLNLTGIYNPYPNIKNFNILLPCVNSLLIKCRYFIHISLSFDSMVTESYRPKIDLPIWITHQSKKEVNDIQRIEDEELKMAIEISKIEYIGGDDSNLNLIDKENFNNLKGNDNDNILQNNNYDNNILNIVPKNKSNFDNLIPDEEDNQDNINNKIYNENINNYPNINQKNYSNQNINNYLNINKNYYPANDINQNISNQNNYPTNNINQNMSNQNNYPTNNINQNISNQNNYPTNNINQNISNQINYPTNDINQNVSNQNDNHLNMITNAIPNQNINNKNYNNNQISNIKNEFITPNNLNQNINDNYITNIPSIRYIFDNNNK